MKVLKRVLAVLAAVSFAAPALACSDMWQQTTAEKKVEQPAVAKTQQQKPQTAKKTAKAQTKASKDQAAKVAAN